MYSYCTLFNVLYLDKGLAMLRSLRAHNQTARLYALALDNKTYKVLKERAPSGTNLIKLQEIESVYPYLPTLKAGRSMAEYYWTLTPHIIEFILDAFGESACTYLDSDLWFFKDPDILNRELDESGGHTLIVSHRFPDTIKGREQERRNGTYCVQFNTFSNHLESRRLLSWWKDRVVENCEYNQRKGSGGDQKYLEKFPGMSRDVRILAHQGGGVAPWNIARYIPKGNMPAVKDSKGIYLQDKATSIRFPLVFYHYQNIKYLTQKIVNLGIGRANPSLKRIIYLPYLKEIARIRMELAEGYDIRFKGSHTVSRNPFLAFAQLYVTRVRIKDFSFSDIIRFNP